MGLKQFVTIQTAAFVFFGLALMLVPALFLEGIYRVDEAGDVGWIRLFGAALLGVGAMEGQLLSQFERYREIFGAFIAVPALLTIAFLWNAVGGTDVYNEFFTWSSIAITGFFTLGHVWFRRQNFR